MKLTQGDAKATVKRRGFLNWDVEIIRPGYQVIERTFDTYQGAIAFARLKLHDIATNPDPAATLIPGVSVADAWVKAGHRVVKGVTSAAKSGLKHAKRLVRGNPNPTLRRLLEKLTQHQQAELIRNIDRFYYAAIAEGFKPNEAQKFAEKRAVPEARKLVGLQSKNPLDLAQQRHEEFTGFPSEEILELIQRQHVHSTLSGLAQFVAFNLIGTDGEELPPMLAPGMSYSGPREEIFLSFKGTPKGDWKFDQKTPAGKIVWLTASEQTERGGREIKQQLYLSGGDQKLDDAGLKNWKMGARDIRDNMLIGTIARVWYWTRKTFEAQGKEKVWFFHDFGKEGSAGVCPVLIYHPLNPSFEIAGGRYYIALPDKKLGNVSPGIVG